MQILANHIRFVKEVTTQAKSEWKWVIPDIFQGVKLEVGAYAFFYANVNAGPQGIFRTLGAEGVGELEFFEVKAGVKLEGKLASEATQAADKDYVSDYKTSIEIGITPSADTVAFLQLFAVVVPDKLEFKVAYDLDVSPTATATANQNTFKIGDSLKFNVKLDKVKFLPLDYNVESISIYRKEAGSVILVAEAPVSEGQTSVDIPWIATLTGAIETNFIAFANTKVLPVLKLELATVIPKPLTGKVVFDIDIDDTQFSESGTLDQIGYRKSLAVYKGKFRIEGIATIGAALDNFVVTSTSGTGTISGNGLDILEFIYAETRTVCKYYREGSNTSTGSLPGSGYGNFRIREDTQIGFQVEIGVSILGQFIDSLADSKVVCPPGIPEIAPIRQVQTNYQARPFPSIYLSWQPKPEEVKKGTYAFKEKGSSGTVSWDFTEPQ